MKEIEISANNDQLSNKNKSEAEKEKQIENEKVKQREVPSRATRSSRNKKRKHVLNDSDCDSDYNIENHLKPMQKKSKKQLRKK